MKAVMTIKLSLTEPGADLETFSGWAMAWLDHDWNEILAGLEDRVQQSMEPAGLRPEIETKASFQISLALGDLREDGLYTVRSLHAKYGETLCTLRAHFEPALEDKEDSGWRLYNVLDNGDFWRVHKDGEIIGFPSFDISDLSQAQEDLGLLSRISGASLEQAQQASNWSGITPIYTYGKPEESQEEGMEKEREYKLQDLEKEDQRAWETEKVKQGFRAIGYLEALTGLDWDKWGRMVNSVNEITFDNQEHFDLHYLWGWIYYLMAEIEPEDGERIKLETLPAWIQEWYDEVNSWEYWRGYTELAKMKEDLAQAETIEDLLGPEESQEEGQ